MPLPYVISLCMFLLKNNRVYLSKLFMNEKGIHAIFDVTDYLGIQCTS